MTSFAAPRRDRSINTEGSTNIKSSRSRNKKQQEEEAMEEKRQSAFTFSSLVEAPAPRDLPLPPAPSPSSPRQRVPSPRSPRQPQPCCTDLFPGLRRTVHMCTEHLRRAAHRPRLLPVRDDEHLHMSRPTPERASGSPSTAQETNYRRDSELTTTAPEETVIVSENHGNFASLHFNAQNLASVRQHREGRKKNTRAKCHRDEPVRTELPRKPLRILRTGSSWRINPASTRQAKPQGAS